MSLIVEVLLDGAFLIGMELWLTRMIGGFRNGFWWGFNAVAYPAVAAMWALLGALPTAGGCLIVAAFSAWMWWRNGGSGKAKRAAKELGAKSKARVEVLARQMTPSPIPSPAGAR